MKEQWDAGALVVDTARLSDLPIGLHMAVVTSLIGDLPTRIDGACQWRQKLLTGELPCVTVWPGLALSQAARRAMEQLGLLRFLVGNTVLVNELLGDCLNSFANEDKCFDEAVLARLQEIQNMRRQVSSTEDCLDNDWRLTDTEQEALRPSLREAAEDAVLQTADRCDQEILTKWSQHVRLWRQISDVFGDLGNLTGRGFDLSLGVLKHVGWKNLLRLHQLVAKLPQVSAIIQTLGQLRQATDGDSITQQIMVPMERLEQEMLEIQVPRLPEDIRGIERSGDIARMLPMEAAYLGHPVLKLLWHARRMEQALLTYRVEGVEVERRPRNTADTEAKEVTRPRPDRGPILAILDTSGSMAGIPEQVAKALVLEAMRTAHKEKRRCFVYAFSGPGQIQELELSLDQQGIAQLLEFLGWSFGGGSDETGVMAKVLERLTKNDWDKSDVLFVSDGEWPVPDRLKQMTAMARGKGSRFHGVQIGNRGPSGLHRLCDPVHVFTDWFALASVSQPIAAGGTCQQQRNTARPIITLPAARPPALWAC